MRVGDKKTEHRYYLQRMEDASARYIHVKTETTVLSITPLTREEAAAVSFNGGHWTIATNTTRED